MELQHFLLTRFNILLWRQDKEGGKVRTTQWLEHRFSLFEKFCLPSIKNQTCQNFEWIVLFDSKTPDNFKDRIAGYQKDCPQLIPVFVEPERGRYFADIFRSEIVKRLKATKVLSTYLDNDDALNVRFVEDLQQRALTVDEGSFINYDDGYQYYADDKFMMRVHYPTNHFVSVVENGDIATVKGIFGYGSHATIDRIKDVKIECIPNQRMWCEVVHERNVMNDAKILTVYMVKDEDLLRNDFAVDDDVRYGIGIYVCRFLPRYIKTFVWRTKYYMRLKIYRRLSRRMLTILLP